MVTAGRLSSHGHSRRLRGRCNCFGHRRADRILFVANAIAEQHQQYDRADDACADDQPALCASVQFVY
jgi:hypothetical protein